MPLNPGDEVEVAGMVQGPSYMQRGHARPGPEGPARNKRPRLNAPAPAATAGASGSRAVVVDLTNEPNSPSDDDEIQILGEVRRGPPPTLQPSATRVRMRIPSSMRQQLQPQAGAGALSPGAHAAVAAAAGMHHQHRHLRPAVPPPPPRAAPQLPQAQWHPAIPQAPPSPERGFKCSICYERKEDLSATSCGHVFCTECITQWVKKEKKCPKCRKSQTLKQLHKIFLDA